MPVRVKTESGAFVTIPDDFYDPEVHGPVIEGDPNETPFGPDGLIRPPTYPTTKTSAKSAARNTTTDPASDKEN